MISNNNKSQRPIQYRYDLSVDSDMIESRYGWLCFLNYPNNRKERSNMPQPKIKRISGQEHSNHHRCKHPRTESRFLDQSIQQCISCKTLLLKSNK